MIWLLLTALAADPARGELLAGLGGCAACHTSPGGPAYAGGHAIITAQGTYYGSNLTPDPTHGLGTWSEQDFSRAIRQGRSPGGHAYWPAFPYLSFAGLTEADVSDLWAWLRTVPASATPDRPHEPKGIARLPGARGLFRSLTWRADPVDLPDGTSPILARGAWLGIAVGHCGECHTPRDDLGRPRRRLALSGAEGPSGGPDITPTAIGRWTLVDLVDFFSSGMTPEGDVMGGEMARVVREGTARLTDEDRTALAAWLLSQPPVRRPRRLDPPAEEEAESEW